MVGPKSDTLRVSPLERERERVARAGSSSQSETRGGEIRVKWRGEWGEGSHTLQFMVQVPGDQYRHTDFAKFRVKFFLLKIVENYRQNKWNDKCNIDNKQALSFKY